VAALLLAWRGAIPFHACAVEIDGKAILISGATGAGKSTLTAALVAQGARFIADDLSVVDWYAAQDCFIVQPGRPALRLYPATAVWINPVRIEPVTDDPRGKILATPARQASSAVPVAGLIRLGAREDPVPLAIQAAVLQAQLFRPKWLAQLPHHTELQQKLRALAVAMRIARMTPPIMNGTIASAAFSSRARALIRSAILLPHSAVQDGHAQNAQNQLALDKKPI
ncbi:MAG: hypothetical protein RL367_528, partial [Pseudomonadota bacterium]